MTLSNQTSRCICKCIRMHLMAIPQSGLSETDVFTECLSHEGDVI